MARVYFYSLLGLALLAAGVQAQQKDKGCKDAKEIVGKVKAVDATKNLITQGQRALWVIWVDLRPVPSVPILSSVRCRIPTCGG